MNKQKMKVKVYRFDPEGDEEGRLETYEVPYQPNMRVLHLLRYIQENIDGTLSFRWNCRAGACGSCAVRLNGKPVLACKTEVTEDMRDIVIEPLLTLPVIKDLVVDTKEIENRIIKLKPWFIAKKKERKFFRIFDEEVVDVQEMRKCIHCYACHDACPVIRGGVLDYIGPKQVVKIASFDYHPKDAIRRSFMLKKEGIWNCFQRRCCSEVCPKEIKISENAIVFAKESVVDDMGLIDCIKKMFKSNSR